MNNRLSNQIFVVFLIFFSFIYADEDLPLFWEGDWTESRGVWTWIDGSDESVTDREAVYGTLGVADILNNPGPRYSTLHFDFFNGDHYLFGGQFRGEDRNSVKLNDLWMWGESTNYQWMWLGGSQGENSYGTYAGVGVSDETNWIGARSGSGYGFNQTHAWVFGGKGMKAGTFAVLTELNDLWSYEIATKRWICHQKCESTSQVGVYNTMGLPDVTSIPGGRRDQASWMSGNDLFIFGGFGHDYSNPSQNDPQNDLWKLDTTTLIWTWMGGSMIAKDLGFYFAKNIEGQAYPKNRYSSSFVLDGDYVYLYGGFTEQDGEQEDVVMGDLFRYNIVNNLWTWLSGESTPGTLPKFSLKQNVFFHDIHPGAKAGAMLWKDVSQNTETLNIFGGLGPFLGSPKITTTGTMNDYWAWSIDNKQWAWIGGSGVLMGNATYGELRVPNINNYPSGRAYSTQFHIKDKSHIMYQGYRYFYIPSSDTGGQNENSIRLNLEDMWLWVPGITSSEKAINVPIIGAVTSISISLAGGIIAIIIIHCIVGQRRHHIKRFNPLLLFAPFIYITDFATNILFTFDSFNQSVESYIPIASILVIVLVLIVNVAILLYFYKSSMKDEIMYKWFIDNSPSWFTVMILSIPNLFTLRLIHSGISSSLQAPLTDEKVSSIYRYGIVSIYLHAIPMTLIQVLEYMDLEGGKPDILITALCTSILALIWPFILMFITFLYTGADRDYGDDKRKEREKRKKNESDIAKEKGQKGVYNPMVRPADISWSFSEAPPPSELTSMTHISTSSFKHSKSNFSSHSDISDRNIQLTEQSKGSTNEISVTVK